MDATATEDQRLLLDSTVRFIEDVCPLERVRAGAFRDPAFRTDYLRRTAELGWTSMLVPGALGGGSVSGNGLLDAALLATKRGAGLQPGPFVGTNVAAHALSSAGRDEQRSELLPGLLSGTATVAWVADAPILGGDPTDRLRVRRVADGFELSGTAPLVPDASFATWLLVTASGDDGLVQLVVPSDAPAVSITELESLDLTRQFARVRFDGAALPASSAIGEPGGGAVADLVDEQLAVACVLTAAESVGTMGRDFRMALEYSKERIAFGRPIGSFQAIKHLLADTSLAVETSEAVTLAAADALGRRLPPGRRMATMAKAFVADTGIDVAQRCFQVFGGIGFTWEHDHHLYLRRLSSDAALVGTADWHRERLCVLSGI